MRTLTHNLIANSVLEIRVVANRSGAGLLAQIDQEISAASHLQFCGLLLNFERCKRHSASSLAELVECFVRHSRKLRLAICALDATSEQRLIDFGLDQALSIFADVGTALHAPEFTKIQMRAVAAIILQERQDDEISAVENETKSQLLELAGSSVVAHQIRHLSNAGIGRVIVDLDPIDELLVEAIGHNPAEGIAVTYSTRSAAQTLQVVKATPTLTETLSRIIKCNHLFQSDFLVQGAHAFANIDLHDLMEHHLQSTSDLTIAHFEPTDDKNLDPNSKVPQKTAILDDSNGLSLSANSVFALSPFAAREISKLDAKSAKLDLMTFLKANGAKIGIFHHHHPSAFVSQPSDILSALEMSQSGDCPIYHPNGDEIDLVHEIQNHGAVSRKTIAEGPVYIDPTAKIEAGVKIVGPAHIAAGVIIERNCFIRNSVVEAGTRASPGTILDGMVANGDWAYAHTFEKPTRANRAPLSGLSWVDPEASKFFSHTDQLSKKTGS